MRIDKATTRSHTVRQGFTLTEMLVATALVVLIMLMFAQIYGSAVGSIREQRGLANNDQKARIIETTLRNDLQSMTYRQPVAPYGNVQGIVAMASGDDLIIDPTHQRGYFFFDENTRSNDRDDIIQFTIQIRGNQRGDVQDRLKVNRYVGKARNLAGSGADDNEPERDDGIDGNSQGSSTTAEVCYFLRGGNLYRRLLLLRDPLPRAVPVDSQPTRDAAQTRLFQDSGGIIGPNYPNDSFYRDFDYAATRVNDALWLHSVESLANNMGERNVPIALPRYRFGFNINNGASVDEDSNNLHIGRFTLRESSHDNFRWPGNGTNNPYTRSDLTLDVDDFTIDQFRGNDRIAEDILLTNVEAFNVELFNPDPDVDDNDPTTNDDQVFYSPPITPSPGASSPLFTATTFDTWHPEASGSSPARRLIKRENDYSFVGSDLSVRRTGNNSTAASSLPNYILIPAMNPTFMNRLRAYENDSMNPQPVVADINNVSLIYRRITNSGTSAAKVPEFPAQVGTIVEDNEIRWECVENRVPLRAIKITVRYRDVGSSLARQVSIIHSFVE